MRNLTLLFLFVGAIGCTNGGGSSSDNGPKGNPDPRIQGITLNPTEIGVGRAHVCVIASQQVKCWGDNVAEPVPPGLKNPHHLVTNYDYNCVESDDGLKCWSAIANQSSNMPSQPNDLQNPRNVSAGYFSMCAMTDTGLRCWGNVMDPKGLKNPRLVTIGYDNACALTDDGVKCWGSDDKGKSTPPPGLKNPRSLALGWNHSCALTDDGIICWGDAAQKKLTFPKLEKIQSIVSRAGDGTCAVGSDGYVCWHRRDQSNTSYAVKPVPNLRAFGASENRTCWIADRGVECPGVNVPSGLINPRLFATGFENACALTDDGIKCWGIAGKEKSNLPPTNLSGVPTALAKNGDKSCAVVNGRVECWGWPFPYTPTDWKDVTAISMLSDTICGISEGQVLCQTTFPGGIVAPPLKHPRNLVTDGVYQICAIDDDGPICFGKYRPFKSPIPLRNPHHLTVNDKQACAIEGDKIAFVRCWDSEKNVLPVPELENPTEVAIGDRHSCAITDLGVRCWGDNYRKQLEYPKDLRHPRNMFARNDYTCVVTDDGLRCWGHSVIVDSLPNYSLVR